MMRDGPWEGAPPSTSGMELNSAFARELTAACYAAAISGRRLPSTTCVQ